ncbi:MAG: GNVR domain-containing protein [Armatimonadota bacterium]|nr:GNVR domain-containing protein [Armatimonadota bacterium]
MLCTVLGAGAAFVVSTQTTPVYEASATLLVHQAPSGDGSDYQNLLTSERLARTYSEMLTGRPIMERVIDELALDETAEELAERVTVELVRDTQLIRLKVEHTDPGIAARAANAVAEAFVAYTETLQQSRYAESMSSLQAQMDDLARLIEETEGKLEALGRDEAAEEARLEGILAGYRNTYSTLVQNYEAMRVTAARSADDVLVYEEARVPRRPVRPRTLMNTALAAVVGAMIGVGTAFLIEYLDDSVRSPEDVERAAGLETVGVIGQAGGEEELVMVHRPLSPVAEGFRKLRTNLEFLAVDEALRTLMVTSPGPAEGKSVVAANLAAAAAQAAEALRQAGAKVVGAVLNNVPTGGGGYYNYRYYYGYGDEYDAYYGEDGKGGKRGRAKGLVSRVRDVLRNRQ